MGEHCEQFCISCSKILNKNHGKLIRGTLFELLQVLFDNSNLEFQKGSKICENCEEKVIVAFRFKGMCIYTYDRLHPYISRYDGNNETVDLKVIYAKELQCEEANDGYICRLCLELVEESDKNLLIDSLKKKNLEATFNMYLPEVNLEVIKDPIICKRCLHSLGEFMSSRRFINNILKIVPQKQLNNGDCFKNNQQDSHIKNKTIYINSAKEEECSENPELLYFNSKYDSNCFERISESGMYRCKICLKEFKKRGSVANHMHSHIGWLRCKVCSYKSKREKSLKNHEKIHDFPEIELKIYKCNKCEYWTKNKKSFKNHERNHDDVNAKDIPDSFEISKSGMYRCNLCLREFKKRANVATHMISHAEIWFKCKVCSYKSKRENFLKNHEKIHYAPEIELKMYKCNKCKYRTKNKYNLRIHEQSQHSKILECQVCSFKTKYSHSFRKHQYLYHPIPIQNKCFFCSYKTTHIDHLQKHLKRAHPNTEIYKCRLCTYETNIKHFLNRHMVIHKDITTVKMSEDQM